MADPVSIISLLGTAKSLATTVINYASGVKNASKTLKELRSELMNLQSIFGRILIYHTSMLLENLFDIALH